MQDGNKTVDREPVLPGLLRDSLSKDWNIRAGAAYALRRAGASAISALVRLTSDDNDRVRENASDSLGKICPITAVKPLADALVGQDAIAREGAAEALTKMLMNCSCEKLDAFESRLDEAAALSGAKENAHARAVISYLKRDIARIRCRGTSMGGLILTGERPTPPKELGNRQRAKALRR